MVVEQPLVTLPSGGIEMKEKEITIGRKMARKLKEYMKEDIFNIDILKLEIGLNDSFRYQSGIFDGVKNDHQGNIEEQYHNEMTQDSIWGAIF